jgi:hypothetical protein
VYCQQRIKIDQTGSTTTAPPADMPFIKDQAFYELSVEKPRQAFIIFFNNTRHASRKICAPWRVSSF